MSTNPLFDFSHLSPAERIQLAQDLWDSIEPEELEAELPLTDEQRAELDRRLEDLRRDPDSGASWPEVRKRIEQQLDQDTRGGRQRRGA